MLFSCARVGCVGSTRGEGLLLAWQSGWPTNWQLVRVRPANWAELGGSTEWKRFPYHYRIKSQPYAWKQGPECTATNLMLVMAITQPLPSPLPMAMPFSVLCSPLFLLVFFDPPSSEQMNPIVVSWRWGYLSNWILPSFIILQCSDSCFMEWMNRLNHHQNGWVRRKGLGLGDSPMMMGAGSEKLAWATTAFHRKAQANGKLIKAKI